MCRLGRGRRRRRDRARQCGGVAQLPLAAPEHRGVARVPRGAMRQRPRSAGGGRGARGGGVGGSRAPSGGTPGPRAGRLGLAVLEATPEREQARRRRLQDRRARHPHDGPPRPRVVHRHAYLLLHELQLGHAARPLPRRPTRRRAPGELRGGVGAPRRAPFRRSTPSRRRSATTIGSPRRKGRFRRSTSGRRSPICARGRESTRGTSASRPSTGARPPT